MQPFSLLVPTVFLTGLCVLSGTITAAEATPSVPDGAAVYCPLDRPAGERPDAVANRGTAAVRLAPGGDAHALDLAYDAGVPGRVIVADGRVVNPDNRTSLRGVAKDGNAAFLVAPDDAALWRDEFTVEMFVKTESAPPWGEVAAKRRADGRFSWLLQLQSDTGRLRARLDTNPADAADGPAAGFNQWVDSRARIADGAWHHVAATFDRATRTFRLYVDYAEVGATGLPRALQYDDGPLALMKGFTGRIDEFRFTDAELEPEQFLRVRE